MSECTCGYGGWFSPPSVDCPLHGTNPAALRAQADELIARANAAEHKERVAHYRKVADALRVVYAHMRDRRPITHADLLNEAERLTQAANLLEGS